MTVSYRAHSGSVSFGSVRVTFVVYIISFTIQTSASTKLYISAYCAALCLVTASTLHSYTQLHTRRQKINWLLPFVCTRSPCTRFFSAIHVIWASSVSIERSGTSLALSALQVLTTSSHFFLHTLHKRFALTWLVGRCVLNCSHNSLSTLVRGWLYRYSMYALSKWVVHQGIEFYKSVLSITHNHTDCCNFAIIGL